MRNLFKKPLFLAFISTLVLTLLPFNIPPAPKAKAEGFQTTVFQAVVSFKKVTVVSLLAERTPEASKGYARDNLQQFGWNQTEQWDCLEALWQRESNWRPEARNTTAVKISNGKWVHAGGIPQILDLDPSLSVEEQIHRGFVYIESRFGSPCKAWEFWKRNYSY